MEISQLKSYIMTSPTKRILFIGWRAVCGCSFGDVWKDFFDDKSYFMAQGIICKDHLVVDEAQKWLICYLNLKTLLNYGWEFEFQ